MPLSLPAGNHCPILESGTHLGYEYIVTHNSMGFRCGYVRVPVGHPFHGLTNRDSDHIAVHGGITFSDLEPGDVESAGWWLGFDCGHSCDAPDPTLTQAAPSYWSSALRTRYGGAVRSTEYVREQCHLLCQQAADACRSIDAIEKTDFTFQLIDGEFHEII